MTHPVAFSLGAAALGTLWFNGSLWRYLAEQLDFSTGFAFAASFLVWLLPATLSAVLFTSLALFSNRALKACVIVLSLANAVALDAHTWSAVVAGTCLGVLFTRPFCNR